MNYSAQIVSYFAFALLTPAGTSITEAIRPHLAPGHTGDALKNFNVSHLSVLGTRGFGLKCSAWSVTLLLLFDYQERPAHFTTVSSSRL